MTAVVLLRICYRFCHSSCRVDVGLDLAPAGFHTGCDLVQSELMWVCRSYVKTHVIPTKAMSKPTAESALQQCAVTLPALSCCDQVLIAVLMHLYTCNRACLACNMHCDLVQIWFYLLGAASPSFCLIVMWALCYQTHLRITAATQA